MVSKEWNETKVSTDDGLDDDVFVFEVRSLVLVFAQNVSATLLVLKAVR